MTGGGFEREQYCYLTTKGRATGRPHEIEIWFAVQGSTLYLLSGGGRRSDWVRNLIRDPNVTVRVGDRVLAGRARLVEAGQEDALARRLVHDRYAPTYRGSLTDWRDTSSPVAVDLALEPGQAAS